MTGMDASDWAAIVAAAAAVATVIISVVYGRRQHKVALAAQDAADESATAASRSAAAAERVAQIEADRDHRAQRPAVRLSFPSWIFAERIASFEVRSHHGTTVAQVRVELAAPHLELAAFEDWSGSGLVSSFVVNDLQPGMYAQVPFKVGPLLLGRNRRKVPMLLTLSDNEGRAWETQQVRVRLPQPPFAIH